MFNSSKCRNCFVKNLVCVPANSSAKHSFATAAAHKIECSASSVCLDHHFSQMESCDEILFKSSTKAPMVQNASERGLAGISGSTEPKINAVWLNPRAAACSDVKSDSSSQSYGMEKGLIRDENDTDADGALGVPCAFQAVTARMDEASVDGLTEAVSHDNEQYTNMMLWLNGSLPNTRQRHLSFLVSSLLNEEVIPPRIFLNFG
jgi:hypothetical protein